MREDDDQRREVEPHLNVRQPPADRPQHRLGDPVQEPHDRIERVGADPRDERPRDDDPEVRLEHELEQPGQRQDEVRADEHQAGPRPSSRER